jgi:hypothetical protein
MQKSFAVLALSLFVSQGALANNDASSTDIMGGGTPGYMEGGVKKPLERVQEQEYSEQQTDLEPNQSEAQHMEGRGSINTGDELPRGGKRSSED